MRTVVCEEKIRLCTQRCLALAINQAMTAAENENWFATLKENEDKVRLKNPNFAVIKEGHTRISQCDFQAVLKILYYRKNYRETTFPELHPKEKDKVQSVLLSVIDFRNSEIAHKPVLEEKDFVPGEYSYDNAILDMLYLLHFFPEIQGPAPRSEEEYDEEAEIICYYDEATKVFEQYKAEGGQRDYVMENVIQKYRLNISLEQCCEACDRLNIVRFYPKEAGKWYFSSADIEKDVSAIKAYSRTQKPATKKKLPYILLAGIVITLIVLSTVVSGIAKLIKNLFNTDSSKIDSATKAQIQEEIDNFASDFGNTYYLTLGENHKPQAAVWLNGGSDNTCYSTNEDVVTATSGGIVKAVGEGEAFVVIRSGKMFKVYKYIVSK